MAELGYATDSKPVTRKGMDVQLISSAYAALAQSAERRIRNAHTSVRFRKVAYVGMMLTAAW